MTILGKCIIDDFVLKHAPARNPFGKWLSAIKKVSPSNHNELKQIFPLADYVGNKRYVFNIGGNKYRLVAVIAFVEGVLIVRWCGTHAEYSRKGDCSNV
jgi:mRNA interferase HigB